MEKDFRALLANHAPLIALVGTRIYPVTYAQGSEAPAIRYNVINSTPGLHMQGSDGLTDTLIQVDIRGTTYQSVIAVRDVLSALLHAFRGVQGATDFRIISVSADRGVRFEKPDNIGFYTASIDFNIWSRVAA